MLRIERRASPSSSPSDELELIYDDRKKSRLRVKSRAGLDVAIVLSRGSALRDGDLLEADSGQVLRVRAAQETLSEVSAGDPRQLARAAYHLGNRHVPVQVEAGWLRYQHDHVLDGMIVALGLRVDVVQAAFEPEGGAYGAGQHSHGGGVHDHDHDHDYVHVHDHVQEHAHVRGREAVEAFAGPEQVPYVLPSSQPFTRLSAVDLVPEYDPEPTEPAIFLRERQAVADEPARPASRLSAYDEVPHRGHEHAQGDDSTQLDEHSFDHDHAQDPSHEHPRDLAANALAERLKRRRNSASSLVPHHITLEPQTPAADSGEPKPPTRGKRS